MSNGCLGGLGADTLGCVPERRQSKGPARTGRTPATRCLHAFARAGVKRARRLAQKRNSCCIKSSASRECLDVYPMSLALSCPFSSIQTTMGFPFGVAMVDDDHVLKSSFNRVFYRCWHLLTSGDLARVKGVMGVVITALGGTTVGQICLSSSRK